jgi:hypothetical protein
VRERGRERERFEEGTVHINSSLFVFSRTLSALVHRVPFLLYLALRSLGYLVAILMGLAVGAWLLRASAESEHFQPQMLARPGRYKQKLE